MTTSAMPRLRRLLLGACALAASFAAPASAEAYRLQAGDVVEFTILGTPGLKQRAPVGIDGQIRIPVGGSFTAAGRTLEEVQGDIVENLKSKLLSVGADPKGDTIWKIIYPEEIALDIVEYQPIYLTGDIFAPGAQGFRSGLTVRQAASVAGGYNLFRTRVENPVEIIGIEKAYDGLLVAYVAAQAREIRLQAELAGDTPPDFAALASTRLDPSVAERFARTETEEFSNRVTAREKQRAAIRQAISQSERRAAILTEQQDNAEKEIANYEADLTRVENLFKRGLVQAGQFNEAQRAILLASSRSLEVSSEASRLEREVIDLRRDLEKVDSDSRLAILDEMRTTHVALLDTQARLREMSEKIAFFAPLSAGESRYEARPKVRIVRQTSGKAETIDADEDTALAPGDVVEITLAGSSETYGPGEVGQGAPFASSGSSVPVGSGTAAPASAAATVPATPDAPAPSN